MWMWISRFLKGEAGDSPRDQQYMGGILSPGIEDCRSHWKSKRMERRRAGRTEPWGPYTIKQSTSLLIIPLRGALTFHTLILIGIFND